MESVETAAVVHCAKTAQEREAAMFKPDALAECNICRREYTSFHFEVVPGIKVYVCQSCLESSKDNFIWICLNCGQSYLRSKNLVMNRMNGYGIKFAALLYESQIIQGLEMCMTCNPDGIVDSFVKKKTRARERSQTSCKHYPACVK